MIGKAHPNLYEVVEAMQEEERYAAQQRQLVSLGEPPPKKKRRYQQNDARLQRLAQGFEEIIAEGDGEEDPWKRSYLKYMRAVGHSARGMLEWHKKNDKKITVRKNSVRFRIEKNDSKKKQCKIPYCKKSERVRKWLVRKNP